MKAICALGALVVLSTPALAQSRRDPVADPQADSAWEYPLRLGDSRAATHELLGNATRTTDALEDYPMSGVTVWFDSGGRVAKLNFAGDAAALNSVGPFDWIPTDRRLVLGLTAHTDEAGFRRVLGWPIRETQVGPREARQARLVWRSDLYLVDAVFLASDRVQGGKKLAKGCLVWVEVSPGL
jgi:hypothetical protein